MYELINYNLYGTNKNYPNHFHWDTSIFNECGLNSSCVANTVYESLPGKIKVNNIASSQIKTNDTTNGLDIRYGHFSEGYSTAYFATVPPQELVDQAFVRYGPIAKPTSITIDLKAIFGVNLRECFQIIAITEANRYNLFNLYQGTVDGNYSYGRNGIWCNNSKTKLKSLSSTTTYSGTLQLSTMTSCFTQGETTCDIAIIRLKTIYWSGDYAGIKNASTLYIKNLEIQ